jgi:hypothetical protein
MLCDFFANPNFIHFYIIFSILTKFNKVLCACFQSGRLDQDFASRYIQIPIWNTCSRGCIPTMHAGIILSFLFNILQQMKSIKCMLLVLM